MPLLCIAASYVPFVLLPSSLLLLNAEASETRDAECRRVPKEMVEACVGSDAALIQYLHPPCSPSRRRKGETLKPLANLDVLFQLEPCWLALGFAVLLADLLGDLTRRSGSRQMLSPLLQPGVDSIGEAGGSNLVKKVP